MATSKKQTKTTTESQSPASTRQKLLEHIENNASKNEFVIWLNNQHGGAYSESADWSAIKGDVTASNVSTKELHAYAESLSSDTDIKKLLKDVEEQTSEAQVVADKLSLLSTLKKFAVATGGACLLSGILLLALAASFWFDVLELQDIESMYLVGVSLLLGTLQIMAGLLLVSE